MSKKTAEHKFHSWVVSRRIPIDSVRRMNSIKCTQVVFYSLDFNLSAQDSNNQQINVRED